MKLDIFDVNDFVRVNGCLPVTSRFYLGTDGGPADDGLFSTAVFGKFGSEDRKTKFGYIDLRRKFFHPLVYVTIFGMFRALPRVISGEVYLMVNKDGNLITSDQPKEGFSTGIDFFVKNWAKIRWTKIGVDNQSREKKEDLLSSMKPEEVFLDKYLIIPAYYRDINFSSSAEGNRKISIDGLNALYTKLVNAANSESITFAESYTTQSSVQQTIVDIYTELTKKIAGKRGVIRQAVMGKSVDYSTINVISCPDSAGDHPTKQQVGFNEFGVPLVMALSLFYPYVLKWLEDFFHDYEHAGSIVISGDKRFDIPDVVHQSINSTSLSAIVDAYIKDKTRMIRTQHFWLGGLGDRTPLVKEIKLPGMTKARPFTLTDLFYAACKDIVQGKHVIASRYPITGPESVISCRVKLLTTERTVDFSGPSSEGGSGDARFTDYPWIPADDKGNIMHNKVRWIDTYVPNVAFLKGLGGDFDGDTMRVIGLFSAEANLEAEKMLNSPLNYVDATGSFIRGIHREGALALYMLTKD
jgi:hypothetical protein